MVINYQINGSCGVNKKGTILYSPKSLIYSFCRSFLLNKKPQNSIIYESLKMLVKNPIQLQNNLIYSRVKTNCIWALSNDVLAKEFDIDDFTFFKCASSNNGQRTYLALKLNNNGSRKEIPYSISLSNNSPTSANIKAACGGYVAQLIFNTNNTYYLQLTDPIGILDINIDRILEKQKENREKIIKSIIADKKSRTKVINGTKIYCLIFDAEDISFEYGLSENLFDRVDEKELSENELFENGIYVNVLKCLMPEIND